MAKQKYVVEDGLRDNRWVRVWLEGRGRNREIVVQIWDTPTPDGESQHEWGMPALLGVELAIRQALIQSPIKTTEAQ